LEEIFELGEADEGINEEKELPLLSSLTRLQLSWLPELKCIWKGPTRHVSLQNLIHLELLFLYKLTFIFTPSLAQSLIHLKLNRVKELTFIFTTSLAQSLIHLETLQIKDCDELKHLIREEDGEREIIPESLGFPKLKTLSISRCDELECLPCLRVSKSSEPGRDGDS
jgi:hypothetical protein